MCGLFVSIGFEPNPDCLDIVSHRGPDGRGWRVFQSVVGPVCLGHRRLSIIDLDERASQPMVCSTGRYWLTFNGEIYNFVEIRSELITKGWRFRTSSDSEVLLEAYAAWGESVLDKIYGMFAFAVFDTREQRLFVARDRFGIKPVYYFVSSAGVAFASEIKQLLPLPGFSRRMNLARAYDYLRAGYTDHSDGTMFADARQLRAGQCVTLDLARWRPSAGSLSVRRYYDIPRQPGPSIGESEAAEQFGELLENSVKLHLRSDVRVGSCLSGGLDSSSIVVLMDKLLGSELQEPIHTVSACFAEQEVNEKPFMDAVVAATRCAPHFVYPTPDELFSLAERITWHQDEPFGSTSIYAQWCVFREARRQNVKVMLDGQGADEQLAGYHHSFGYHVRALMRRRDLFGLARLILERKRFHGLRISDQLLSLPNRPRRPDWLRRKKSAEPEPGTSWLCGPIWADCELQSDPFDAALARDSVGKIKTIGELCVAYVLGTSLPMLLRYEDRNSMAHSIEARVPFLDHRLVEFAIDLWDRYKIVGGDTKRILRRAIAKRLPDPVLYRRDKLAFSTPEQRWIRGPLRPAIEAGIRQTLSLYPDMFDKSQMQAFAQSTLSGHGDDSVLWRTVNFGIWGSVFGVTS
jgi:asparagine synthase (glutamine-hydrolysing)